MTPYSPYVAPVLHIAEPKHYDWALGCVALVMLASLLVGCNPRSHLDAELKCLEMGYPKMHSAINNGRIRFFCVRLVNNTHEVKELADAR